MRRSLRCSTKNGSVVSRERCRRISSLGHSNSFAAVPSSLLLFLVLVAGTCPQVFAAIGIPGTTQTINGYDREKGTDAICWKSQSATEGIPFSNPLIKDFVVSFDGVKIQRACPVGNNISGVQPDERVVYGEILRTHREYNYTIFLDINMTSLRADAGFTSDQGPGFVALQVFSCVAGTSGFCSPFVHEQAMARYREAAAAARARESNNPSSSGGGGGSSSGGSGSGNQTNSTGSGSSGGNSSGGGGGGYVYVRGTIHGGTHIHSGWYYVNLPVEEGPAFENVRVDISQIALVPGDYISIAAAQLYFWEESEDDSGERWIARVDMANILRGQQSLVHYQLPAEILDVPSLVVDFSYGLIAFTSLILIFLLYQTIKHREHQIMRLSQGSFLIVFLVAGLTANVTVLLQEPKNDFYCRTGNFVVLISLQLFYAITAGRLWRIHALISPLLLKTLAHHDTQWIRLRKFLQRTAGCCFKRHEARKLRTQVTDSQLSILIGLWTAPQVIIQILAFIIQPFVRSVDFNSDESIGRAECDCDKDLTIGQTIMNYGYAVFCLLIIALLIMALQSRKLPSLFNESKNIFDSTLSSLVIMIMGVAVILVTQEPTTSPAVAYLVWVFTVMSMTINTSLRIVWPKLRMIWRGETVIVSQLVLDHAKETRKSLIRRSSGNYSTNEDRAARALLYDSTSLNASSAGPRGVTNSKSSGASDAQDETDKDLKSSEMVASEVETEEIKNGVKREVASLEEPEKIFDDDGTSKEQSPASMKKSVLIAATEKYEEGTNGSFKKPTDKKKCLLIEADQAPSRWLLLRMVDAQEHLSRVTQRLMSGMAVSQADWEHTRRLTRKMGETFSNEVLFAWEVKIDEGVEEEEDDGKDIFLPEKVDI
ncbi:hypothetical protein ACA910_006945 [Epithemia clementina (nom. ined.)]